MIPSLPRTETGYQTYEARSLGTVLRTLGVWSQGTRLSVYGDRAGGGAVLKVYRGSTRLRSVSVL